MTIAANVDPANIGFGVSEAKRNPASPPGTSHAFSGQDASFGERWQSLLDLDETAGKQVGPQATDLNQSSTIVTLQQDRGSTICANHPGENKCHPRLLHQHVEGSQHKAPSTDQQKGMGMIEPNPGGTLAIPMIHWQTVMPDQHRTMNENQQTSSIESIQPIVARQQHIDNLTEGNLVRQGTGDLRSPAARATHQIAPHATDVTSLSTIVAQEASEASVGRLTVESTQQFVERSAAGPASTARISGAENLITDVGRPQVETSAVAPNLAASDQGMGISNAAEVAVRPTLTANKGIGSGSPSTPAKQLSSTHLASGGASHNSLTRAEQMAQQQPDAGFAHSSIVPAIPNRELGASLPSQASSSPAQTTNVHQTFAALDAENSTAAAKWVHAGRNTAEAGYEDPVLGWVGVRAEAAPSGVHATVVPISADAAQSLGAHLAGLSSYLSEHRTPVETVTISAPDTNSGQHSMGQGGANPSNHGADRGGTPSSPGETAAASRTPQRSAEALDGIGAIVSGQFSAQGGTYVSVLA
jgi:hypothetical protein